MAQAKSFTLLDQHGAQHTLEQYRGKWVVLYFYPKDDTPGCTTEACSFRDEREAIAEYGNAVILGISTDSVKSHKKFADKYGLTFPLLSDPEHKVIDTYGAWQPKKLFGREFIGTLRRTFIIDPAGNIAKEYPSVDPKSHAAEIIKDLQSLQSS